MNESLQLYKRNGSFTLNKNEALSIKCKAPKDAGGVYLVYNSNDNSLIYIGSSGWVCQSGEFKIRTDGMWDRIVNGKQFDLPRRKSWTAKMIEEEIEEIRIEWFVTFNNEIKHIPAYTEASCIQQYFDNNKCLPIWNTDL